MLALSRKWWLLGKFYGTVDGVTLEAFIVKKLVHKFWKGACVVMDNAKFHQGEMVRKSLEQAWARLIYYLPILLSFFPEDFLVETQSNLQKVQSQNL